MKQWLQEMDPVNAEWTHSVVSTVIFGVAIRLLIIPGLLQLIGGTGPA